MEAAQLTEGRPIRASRLHLGSFHFTHSPHSIGGPTLHALEAASSKRATRSPLQLETAPTGFV